MAGRHTKCTPEVISDIANNVIIGMSNKDAAISAGITPRAFYLWKSRGEEAFAGFHENNEPVEESEVVYYEFYVALSRAIPLRKRRLLAELQKAAQGGQEFVETKRTFKRLETPVKGGPNDGATEYQMVMVEEVVTAKTTLPSPSVAQWLLARLHPKEFGKESRVVVEALWIEELITMLRSGMITPEDIKEDLPDDVAQEFFEQAGLDYAGVGKA